MGSNLYQTVIKWPIDFLLEILAIQSKVQPNPPFTEINEHILQTIIYSDFDRHVHLLLFGITSIILRNVLSYLNYTGVFCLPVTSHILSREFHL